MVYLRQKINGNVYVECRTSLLRLHSTSTAGPGKKCFGTGRQKSHLPLSTMFSILFVLIYLVRFPTKSQRWDFCWPVLIYNVSLIYIRWDVLEYYHSMLNELPFTVASSNTSTTILEQYAIIQQNTSEVSITCQNTSSKTKRSKIQGTLNPEELYHNLCDEG